MSDAGPLAAARARLGTLSPTRLAWWRLQRQPGALPGLVVAVLLGLAMALDDVLEPVHGFAGRLLLGAQTAGLVALAGAGLALVLAVLLGAVPGWLGGWPGRAAGWLLTGLRGPTGWALWVALLVVMPRDAQPPEDGTRFAWVVVLASLQGGVGLGLQLRAWLRDWREGTVVAAARLDGVSGPAILARHVGPGLALPVLAALVAAMPGMVLAEAGLSFLGLGGGWVSWGGMLRAAADPALLAGGSGLLPGVLLPGLLLTGTTMALAGLGAALSAVAGGVGAGGVGPGEAGPDAA